MPWHGRAWPRPTAIRLTWAPSKCHEGTVRAQREVEKALALDPDLAEAHSVLGLIKTFYEWDWSGAEAAHERALQLAPGNAAVMRGAAFLATALGRFDKAIALCREAADLDPLSVRAHYYLGLNLWHAGQPDDAEAAVRKALELNPQYPNARALLGTIELTRSKPDAALQEVEREADPFWRRLGLALAYHALGRKNEADAALAELVEKDKQDSAFQIAEVHAFRGEADQAFDWLERAYIQRDGGLSRVKGDPLLKNLEADPRYKAFLRKLNLPI